MSVPDLLFLNAVIVCVLTAILWLVSVRIRDVSIVDLFWGTGFVVIAWVSVFAQEIVSLRSGWLGVCTTLWGLRLSIYLGIRNHGRPEDYRYAEMRQRRGDSFWWISLFLVFWLQAAIMWVVALPLQVGASAASDMQLLNWIGVPIWLIGFVFEAVGDYQLARFKRRGGVVLDQGLWKYTRHPNYFGNAMIWWGLTLIAFEPNTWWTILSPILMTFLLLKVSGVALLERSLSGRSAEYRDYMKRTSAFIPLPPRREC